MSFNRKSLKSISFIVALAYLLLFLPASPAMAGWVSNDEMINSPKAKLISMVERQEVTESLTSMGIDPNEAVRRVARMTDAEAQRALDQLETMPAGGSPVIGAIVFVFVVLLVTDILGYTNVFPFVNPQY